MLGRIYVQRFEDSFAGCCSPLTYNSLPINNESFLLGELTNKKKSKLCSPFIVLQWEKGACQLMLSHNIFLLLANHLSISSRNNSVKGHHA